MFFFFIFIDISLIYGNFCGVMGKNILQAVLIVLKNNMAKLFSPSNCLFL